MSERISCIPVFGHLFLWGLTSALASASIGWAQQAGDATAVDVPPQPVEVYASRIPLTHRLKRDYTQTPFALSITLPEVAQAQQAAQTDAASEPHRPLQIGFGRAMPANYQGDLAPRLKWEPQGDGTVVSAFSVSSPGARALRVAVRAMLPDGAEVRFFGPGDSEQRFPPAARRDFLRPSDVISPEAETDAFKPPTVPALWSPVLEGDTVGVEITLASSSSVQGFSLFIDRVSHLTTSARQAEPRRLAAIGNAASCQIDLACDPDHRYWGNSTAKMVFTEPDGSTGLCTGTLMTGWDGSRWSPDDGYFLTARHCISTQAIARTLNTYWFFERDECGGSAPNRVVQRSAGADILATDPRTNSALLRLRDDPPYGIPGAFPSASSITHPAEVVGIHHPRGDLKKVSRGRTIWYERIDLEGQQIETIKVGWHEGATEPGSTGSGLYDENGWLIGVLSGTPAGQSTCGVNRTASYGRFDLFFPHVRRWLSPSQDDSRVDLSDPPFSATTFINTGLISATDPTTFRGVTSIGRGNRQMYDQEAGKDVTVDAYLFTSRFEGGQTVDMEIDPDVGSTSKVRTTAEQFGRMIGQLPVFLQNGIKTFTLYAQEDYFLLAAGGGQIWAWIDREDLDSDLSDFGNVEEIMIHEGVHAVIQEQGVSTDWRTAQAADGNFISNYARDNPDSEDIAESFPAWLALRYRPDRVSPENAYKIANTIPNRLAYFDSQAFDTYPFTGKPAAQLGPPAEHGNTRGKATHVEPGSPMPGALEQAGDVDYFRVEVTEAGSLTAETIGTTNTVGYLQSTQGQYLAGDDDGGDGDNFRIIRQVQAGTYYVAVVGAHRRTVTGPYTLAVRFTAGGRTVEHGNTRAQATRVVLNTTTAGALERAGDVDYFRVEVAAAGSLTVETTGTTDTFGYIGNAEGGWSSQNDDAGEGNNFRIVRQVTPGMYYVAVVGGNGRRGTGAYSLIVQFPTASRSSDDHGNARAQATHVGLNTDTAGALEQSGDIDYFRVEVAQTGYLTLKTSGNTDTVGYFGSAEGRWLTQNDDTRSDLNFRIIRYVTVGTYYVAVRGWPGLARTGSYTFHVRFTPDRGTDDHENSLGRATNVTLNSTTAGTIGLLGDVDYFQIRITQNGTLTIETAGDTDTYGYLRGADGVILGENDQADEDNDNFQIVRQMTAGTYYVAVRGRDRYTSGYYTLTVRFTAGGSGPPVDDHANISRRATVVELNSTIVGHIEQAGDVDYFQVEVTQVGTLTVETTGNTSIMADFLSTQESYLGSATLVRQITPGTYYVKVLGLDRYTTGPYTLALRFTAGSSASPGDDHGNTRAQATRVMLNTTTAGMLEQADDIDYFQVTLSQSGTLEVEIRGDGPLFYILYGTQGEYLGDDIHLNPITRRAIPGTYWIVVLKNDDLHPAVSYFLKASFTKGQISPIEPNSVIAGNLEQGDDVDSFLLEVMQAGTLTLETQGDMDTVGSLHRLDGSTLAQDDDDGDDFNFRIVRHVTAGTYHIEVTGISGGRGGPYTLHVSFTPD